MDIKTKNIKFSIIKNKHLNWKYLEKITDIENNASAGHKQKRTTVICQHVCLRKAQIIEQTVVL